MHKSSLKLMAQLLDRIEFDRASVLDVGARITDDDDQPDNFCYRPMVERRGWSYTGLDAMLGRNVDVTGSAYELPFPMASFDIVLSGQLLEHLERPHRAVREWQRVLKPGGWMVLIAPREWQEHRRPIDCWRILPDGMRALLEGMDSITADTVGKDTFGVARKPRTGRFE